MKILNSRKNLMHNRVRQFLLILLLGWVCFSTISCSKTVRVYHPPPFDLTRYECLGIIAFKDNADPSVSSYATQQFQNQIHSAQAGIPVLQLGTEDEVLRSVNADRLDFKAFQKIGRKYNVVAVFHGSVMYSDIETDVRLKSIRDLKADVDATLHATFSVQLNETRNGAAVWSNSVSWKRKLGEISLNKQVGVKVGMKGYHDAYRKLIPDMAYNVADDFRGRYIKEKIMKN
jgi:hypothetical protein